MSNYTYQPKQQQGNVRQAQQYPHSQYQHHPHPHYQQSHHQSQHYQQNTDYNTENNIANTTNTTQFLPGTASLVEEVDKKLLVVLRDGRKLIGVLRSFDQFANVVLENAIERIYVKDTYGDIPLGLFVIRGENVVLLGEIDIEKEAQLKLRKVSKEEIVAAFKLEQVAKEAQEKLKRKIMLDRGLSIDPIDLGE